MTVADYQTPASAADWGAGARLATASGVNTQRTIAESANEANRLRDEFNANLRKAKKSAVLGDLGTIAGTAAGFLIPGAAPFAGTIGKVAGSVAGTPSPQMTGIADLMTQINDERRRKSLETQTSAVNAGRAGR